MDVRVSNRTGTRSQRTQVSSGTQNQTFVTSRRNPYPSYEVGVLVRRYGVFLSWALYVRKESPTPLEGYNVGFQGEDNLVLV